MTRVAWFQCFSGIAGDMALAALLDAGADLAEVERLCRALPVPDWTIRAESVMRGGLAATHVVVDAQDQVHHRSASAVLALLASADLPPRVAGRARRVFERLAEVEGRLHGVAPADVEFHEVGAIDSIVDVVGVCAALELLDIDEVCSSPVAQGIGAIRSAHGVLPNPPPAVVRLLEGVPTFGVDIPKELTTPTGAALLATLGATFGPMPPLTIRASGFGAGTRDLPGRANVVQVVIGERAAGEQTRGPVEPPLLTGAEPERLVLLETNLDDVTGEVLGHLVALLLERGARDAWITAATMKKGRPAQVVSVLTTRAAAPLLAALLVEETGTLGVRLSPVERWALARSAGEVDVDGQRIRIKVGLHRAKAEHDDCAQAARALQLPLRVVAARAEAAWAQQVHPSNPGRERGSERGAEGGAES